MKKEIHSSFSINLSEAKKFAKISGNSNKIHLDKIYGLNSFTVFINKKNNYSSSKNSFEKKVKKYFKGFKILIHRIPEINTRQNLSLLNRKLPSFTEYLNKNKNQISKII